MRLPSTRCISPGAGALGNDCIRGTLGIPTFPSYRSRTISHRRGSRSKPVAFAYERLPRGPVDRERIGAKVNRLFRLEELLWLMACHRLLLPSNWTMSAAMGFSFNRKLGFDTGVGILHRHCVEINGQCGVASAPDNSH